MIRGSMFRYFAPVPTTTALPRLAVSAYHRSSRDRPRFIHIIVFHPTMPRSTSCRQGLVPTSRTRRWSTTTTSDAASTSSTTPVCDSRDEVTIHVKQTTDNSTAVDMMKNQTTTTTATRRTCAIPLDKYYLHVGPSGDCWYSHGELYAAKHLQPDYVTSIQMSALLSNAPVYYYYYYDYYNETHHATTTTTTMDDACTTIMEELVQELETNADTSVLQQIYDSGKLPDDVLVRWQKRIMDFFKKKARVECHQNVTEKC